MKITKNKETISASVTLSETNFTSGFVYSNLSYTVENGIVQNMHVNISKGDNSIGDATINTVMETNQNTALNVQIAMTLQDKQAMLSDIDIIYNAIVAFIAN